MRYFLSLARTGSVTKAAELHHISAAAFSKAIKIFESEVGQKLTLPQGRGVTLTDHARGLISGLENIINQIDNIKNNGRTHNEPRGKILRVATFEVFSTHFMTQTIKNHFASYRCEILEMVPGKMEAAVASGKADLALTYLPIPYPELDFLKVQEIGMGIYGHQSLMKSHDYTTLPFAAPVAPIDGSPTKVRGLDGWPDDTFPRNICYHVEMLETALGLCREGLAVAYVPKFVVKLYNEKLKPSYHLQELPLPPRFSKQKSFVYLIKRKSDQEGAEAKKMAQAIRKICF